MGSVAGDRAVHSVRLAAGFSIGGEVPRAITYVVESIHDVASTGCALIMAAMAVWCADGEWLQSCDIAFAAESLAYAWALSVVLGGVLAR